MRPVKDIEPIIRKIWYLYINGCCEWCGDWQGTRYHNAR